MVVASAAGRLGHPAGGAAGRRDERDLGLLGLGGGDEQADRGGLAGARAAGDDGEPVRERRGHRGALLGRRLELLVAHRAGRLEDGLGRGELADPLGELRLERPGRRAVGPRLVVHLDHQLPVVGHRAEQRGVRRRAVQQRRRPRGELGDREAGRAVALRLGEHVDDGGTCARRRVRRDPARAGDRVGDPEPDAEHAGQLVRALADDEMRALAVLLGDPRDEPGEPVRRELEVQRAARPQPVPGADRLVRSLRVQPDGAERAVRVGVDRLQHVRAVARQQLLRAAVAHVLDALEVGEQRGVARRGERLGGRDADLHPEAPVVLPGAADPRALALLEMGDRADQHELVAVALGVEHREAAVLAGEPDPPDRDLALERRAGRALDHRPSEAIAMGGLASGRRGLAPRADHRRAAG